MLGINFPPKRLRSLALCGSIATFSSLLTEGERALPGEDSARPPGLWWARPGDIASLVQATADDSAMVFW